METCLFPSSTSRAIAKPSASLYVEVTRPLSIIESQQLMLSSGDGMAQPLFIESERQILEFNHLPCLMHGVFYFVSSTRRTSSPAQKVANPIARSNAWRNHRPVPPKAPKCRIRKGISCVKFPPSTYETKLIAVTSNVFVGYRSTFKVKSVAVRNLLKPRPAL